VPRPLRALAARRDVGPAPSPRADEVVGCAVGEVEWEVVSVGKAAWPERTSTRRGLGGGRAKPTQKGDLPPGRRGARAKPRGSESTKMHLSSCDGRGRPLSVVLTAGQCHESKQLERRSSWTPSGCPAWAGAARVSVRSTCSPTRATATPPAGACSEGAASGAPSPSGATSASGGRGPREEAGLRYKALFTPKATWWSGACEPAKAQWRGIATRYEKRAVNYRAAVVIASLMIWLTT
jgi:transposase